jgi:tRNA (guanosine-2'-O-)-methyltransferase
VVLEDIHKAHNANAVLRSCEGFGVQDVHIIENTNRFESSSTISLGAHKWLTLRKYSTHDSNVKECFDHLHNQGYTIIATSPHYNSREISDLEVDDKTALVFGTELDGVSEEVIAQCDGFVKIPMVGFVESYNLSVSAAICLHTLSAKLRKKAHDSWCVSDKEKLQLQVEWMLKSTKNGRRIWERYLREQG